MGFEFWAASAGAIKLDDLLAPDDNTDLNATTSVHGLLPKLGGGTTNFLRADGTWSAPAGGGDVTGPAASVDNAIVRFDGTTGKVMQDYTSGAPTVGDTGNVTIAGELTVPDGSDGDPSINFASSATTGLRYVGAGQIAVEANLRVDTSIGVGQNASGVSGMIDVANTGGLQAPNGDNQYIIGTARDNGVGRVEIWRMAGAADPYFSMGGSQEFKFYNSGVADLGNGALTNVNIDSGDIAAGVTINVKLDDLATPDDNTDLNFTTTYHGLVPKGTNVGNFLKDDGTWAAAAGGGDVTGPATSTDNMIARHHSTGGKTLQEYTSNPPTISDTGDVNIDGDLDVENIVVSGTVDGIDVSAHDTATTGVHGVGAGTIAKTTDAPAAHKASHETAGADEINDVDINAGTIDGVTIGAAAAPTVTNLGSVATCDINGGTIGGVTLDGVMTMGETGILLDPVLSGDATYCGITEGGTAGATLAIGDICYLAVADTRWELAKADVAATSFGKLGMCVQTAAADGSATTMLLYGKIRAATLPALTVGAPVFVSAATAGDVTVTAPTGTTNFVVRIIGYGNTAEDLFFCPDNTYVELA